MKTVTGKIKRHFSDDAEWLGRLEEKLARRESNQAKYESFQERENKATKLLDFIELANEVMRELEDVFYARKLLTSAEQRRG